MNDFASEAMAESLTDRDRDSYWKLPREERQRLVDQYFYEGPIANPGCYWFGGYVSGNLWAGHHHQLYGVTLDGVCAGVPGTVCTSSAFSSGVSRLNASSPLVSIAFDDLVLAADRLPATPPQPGIFIAGPTPAQIPFFNGTLCIDPIGLQRFANVTYPNAAGIAVESVSLATSAAGGLEVMANMTHYFQRWNRDPDAGGTNANFSEAIGICFVP